MATGAFLLEWAWYNTTRIHNVDEERDSCFPAFRRIEATHWNKWLHYPQAITLLPLKIWIMIMIAPGSATFVRIITFGYNERPFTGWRKWIIDVHYKAMNIWELIN